MEDVRHWGHLGHCEQERPGGLLLLHASIIIMAMQTSQLRQQRIASELSCLQLQPNLLLTACQHDNLQRDDLWILWVPGRPDSPWQHSTIPVSISFPPDYPLRPPAISFPAQFQHIHVYEDGQICLPVLQNQYWQPKMSMVEVIKRIEALLHQEINPYSPANHKLYQLYKSDREQYDRVMEDQRHRFRDRDGKYYQMACMHIQMGV